MSANQRSPDFVSFKGSAVDFEIRLEATYFGENVMRSWAFALVLSLGCSVAMIAQGVESMDMLSPDATSLGKLIDTRVSPATGVPQIEVPIYAIKHGPIAVPITLNYHSGGIRVYEISNWVGLGWTISTDMMVSRVVRGIPDESDNGYFNTGHQLYYCETQNALDLSFPIHPCLLSQVVNGQKDGQPDIFSYSMVGYSGKFYIGLDENDSLEVRKVDENDVKIEFTYDPDTTAGERILSFTIRTPTGIVFTFGYDGEEEAIDQAPINQIGAYNENWRLVNISSYDEQFNVHFNYAINNYEYNNPDRNFYMRYEVQNDGYQEVNSTYGASFYREVFGHRLESISYDNTNINFIADSIRIDVGANNKMLNEIRLEKGNFCKRWEFQHDYYDSGSMALDVLKKRLRLIQVDEKVCSGPDTGDVAINSYIFEYNGDFLPDIDSGDKDHWGFYNAANNPSNILNIPIDSFTFPVQGNTIVIGGANRETNAEVIDTGILTKIITPTKGHIAYEYEVNDHYDAIGDSAIVCGGIRVSKITLHDGMSSTNDIVKKYFYTEEDHTSGVLFNSNGYPSNMPVYTRTFGIQMGSNPCSFPCPFSGTVPGSCGTAVVYVGEDETMRPVSSFNGSHIFYERVLEMSSDSGVTIYEFYTPDLPPMGPIITFPQPPDQLSLRAGLLQNQIEFDYGMGNNVSEIKNTHTTHYTRSPEYFLMVNPYVLAGNPNGPECGTVDFEYTIYPIYSGNVKLSRIIRTLDSVRDTTHYTYDTLDRHLMPVSQEMVNSDGKVFRNEFFYNFDYPDTTLRNELVVRNIISPPFATDILVDSIQVDGTESEFEFFNQSTGQVSGIPTGSVPRLYKLYRYEKSYDVTGALFGPGKRLQMTISEYDGNGNVATFMKHGWIEKEYIWNADHTLQSSSFGDHSKEFMYFASSGLLKSFTDIDGQVTHYSYDSLLRIDTISERDGNVINNFSYHYHSMSDPFNWIRSSTSFTPVDSSDLELLENYKYFDGLYRLVQNVDVQGSPSFNDVAVSIVYDTVGRVSKEFQPIQTANNSGAYTTPSGDFTHSVYFKNGLDRIQSTTPPSWFATDYDYLAGSVMINPEGTVYPSLSLRATRTTDPDGKMIEEYSDKKGRTVLQRMTDGTDTSDTWMIYDDKNRISKIFPPGSDTSTTELTFRFLYDGDDNLIYRKVPDAIAEEFRYDERNLQTARRNGVLATAGKWLVTHYDDHGRPIKRGFHNGAGEPDDEDEPTIHTLLEEYFYDGFNGSATNPDPIYTGRLKKQRVKMLDDISVNATWIENEFFYDSYGRLSTESMVNHRGGAETRMLIYDFADNLITEIHNISGTNGINHVTRRTYDHRGRQVFNRVNLDGTGLTTVCGNIYDHRNRLAEKNLGRFTTSGDHQYLQSLDYTYNAQNWLTGINDLFYEELPVGQDPCEQEEDLVEEELVTDTDSQDLFALGINYSTTISGSGIPASNNGNLTTLRWWHKGRETQTYSLDYDFLNRVKKAVHGQFNALSYEKVNNYYEDFEYDARGNILSLNRRGLVNRPDLDSICFEPATIDSLTYSYTLGTNKLVQVIDEAPCPEVITLPRILERDVSYAALDEIRVEVTSVQCGIDVLLTAGNQITVLDTFEVGQACDSIPHVIMESGPCPDSKFTEGFNQQSDDSLYLYDNSGNLLVDPNKGLQYHYNYLNLPYLITGGVNDSLLVFYSADGTILRRTFVRGDSTYWQLDYLRGKELRSDTLEAVYFDEGRATPVGSSWQYEYWIRDHLGNVRVTFSDVNNNGLIVGNERKSRHDYYSFGFEHNGIWVANSSAGSVNRYRYNGKEEISALGVNLLDFGARLHDPVIGRFTTIDRYAEKYLLQSPYAMAVNNPVKFVDVNGDSIRYANSYIEEYVMKYAAETRTTKKGKIKDNPHYNKEFAKLISTLEGSKHMFVFTDDVTNLPADPNIVGAFAPVGDDHTFNIIVPDHTSGSKALLQEYFGGRGSILAEETFHATQLVSGAVIAEGMGLKQGSQTLLANEVDAKIFAAGSGLANLKSTNIHSGYSVPTIAGLIHEQQGDRAAVLRIILDGTTRTVYNPMGPGSALVTYPPSYDIRYR